ncbi:MAG: hypothetical protein K6F99_01460 [Lachnospiraceae bacterium]|nr:hypothetical protein [Lachnospiraceae bacterium]
MKKYLSFTAALLAALFILSGCAGTSESGNSQGVAIQNGAQTTGKPFHDLADYFLTGTISGSEVISENETMAAVGMESEEEEVKEGVVYLDFPFEDEMKDYTLYFVDTDSTGEHCVFRLFDEKSTLVQEFGDLNIQGKPEFKYDYLDAAVDFAAISVFPKEADEEFCGYYFAMDLANKHFYPESVKIPKYDGVVSGTYNRLIYTEETDEMSGKRDFYQIISEDNRCVKCKRWEYKFSEKNDFENVTQKITNTIDNKVIYEGPVQLDNDREPINQDFYKSYILNNLNIYEGERDDSILFYNIDDDFLDYKESYDSKEELLKALEMEDNDHIGTYDDEFGNEALDVYYKKSSKTGVVFMSRWQYDSNLKKWASVTAVPFKGMTSTRSLVSFEIMTEKSEMATGGYIKNIEYISGKLKSLKIMDFNRENEDAGYETLIEENYIYRDDGSLYYRGHNHSAYYYEPTYMGMNEKYDELSRCLYSAGYIENGSHEFYNFYEGEKKKPEYQVFIQKSSDTGYFVQLFKIK